MGTPVLEYPVLFGHLGRIRRSVYTLKMPLSAEIRRSAEPEPFEGIGNRAFVPVRPGEVWGRKLDCAWLHIRGKVPAGLKNPVVLLKNTGEALVYTPEGEPIAALTSMRFPGDSPQSGGSFRVIDSLDLRGPGVEFYADCGFNGIMMINLGRGRFGGAYIAEKDDGAYGYYYDYLTLLYLAAALPRGSRRTELAALLGASYRRFIREGAEAARTILAPAFSRAAGAGVEAAGMEAAGTDAAGGENAAFKYSAVGHGHLDLAWLWPIRETIRKAARTYTGVLRNLEIHPSYIYGTSQPQQMLWTREHYPSIYRRLREAILAGRVEIQGGFWVECDTNLPGGESLIRQALYGRRFIAEEFHRDPRICWLPDAFGFSAALPQILLGCGMEYFSTIKLAWNRVNVFPHRSFWWEGIDGSRVLVHMPPEGDYSSKAQPGSLLKGLRKYPERRLGRALLVYGAGDGGGGPNEAHLELLDREKRLPDLPQIGESTALEFFEELGNAGVKEVYQGELYLENHQGTYTTQGQNKYYNRLCERLLHNVEALGVISAVQSAGAAETAPASAAYPRAPLDEAWREVLLYQFHDIIPGSAITRVNRETVEGYRNIEARLEALGGEILAGLAAGSAASTAGTGGAAGTEDTVGTGDAAGPAAGPAAGTAPVLINLTSFDRDEYFRRGDRWFRARIPPYAAAVGEAAPGPFAALTADRDSLGNGILTLRFGGDGEIRSCTGPDGRELAAGPLSGDAPGNFAEGAGGLNRLVLFRDKFEIPFNAWNIDPKYRRRRRKNLRPDSITTMIDGPRAIRTCLYRFGKSTLTQRIILEHGRDLVLFETEADWHERHRMLRAEFFPRDYGDQAKCEIQFGHILRSTTEANSVEKAQFEVCAHRWVSTERDGRGFALLNDCKYGHRLKNGLISLNLLRSPTFPDKEAGRGLQRFTYAFCPFESADPGKVIREAYRLNHPPLASPAGAFGSLARVSDPQVILETLKAAESGEGIVLRLYESLGREAEVSLDTDIPHREVYLTDLLENRGEPGDLRRLRFSPFEIKTVLLARG
jgi:alpha-mannosidase